MVPKIFILGFVTTVIKVFCPQSSFKTIENFSFPHNHSRVSVTCLCRSV